MRLVYVILHSGTRKIQTAMTRSTSKIKISFWVERHVFKPSLCFYWKEKNVSADAKKSGVYLSFKVV